MAVYEELSSWGNIWKYSCELCLIKHHTRTTAGERIQGEGEGGE